MVLCQRDGTGAAARLLVAWQGGTRGYSQECQLRVLCPWTQCTCGYKAGVQAGRPARCYALLNVGWNMQLLFADPVSCQPSQHSMMAADIEVHSVLQAVYMWGHGNAACGAVSGGSSCCSWLTCSGMRASTHLASPTFATSTTSPTTQTATAAAPSCRAFTAGMHTST